MKYNFSKTTQWNDIKAYAETSESIATEFISEYQNINEYAKNILVIMNPQSLI